MPDIRSAEILVFALFRNTSKMLVLMLILESMDSDLGKFLKSKKGLCVTSAYYFGTNETGVVECVRFQFNLQTDNFYLLAINTLPRAYSSKIAEVISNNLSRFDCF